MSSADDPRRAVPLAETVLAPAGADLVLAEWRDPGGGGDPPRSIAPLHIPHRDDIAPLHIPHRDDEAWYVLEGAFRFRLGGETVEAPAGGRARAPRARRTHTGNQADVAERREVTRPEPARYLLVMTERIRALIVGMLIAAWDGWRGSMYRLAGESAHRRQGIALMLVRAGERHLAARGARRVSALVAHEEPDAVALWAAAGYPRDADIARFVRNLR